jgi:hypothetical protein
LPTYRIQEKTFHRREDVREKMTFATKMKDAKVMTWTVLTTESLTRTTIMDRASAL